MRPGGISIEGFLGQTESLQAVLDLDKKTVSEARLIHQDLANVLKAIISICREYSNNPLHETGKDIVLENAYPPFKRDVKVINCKGVDIEIEHVDGTVYRVIMESFRGAQGSPFGDGTYADSDYFVTNVSTKTELNFSRLIPDMVERYGFYEGEGTRYRVSPASIIDFFSIEGERKEDIDSLLSENTLLVNTDEAGGTSCEIEPSPDFIKLSIDGPFSSAIKISIDKPILSPLKLSIEPNFDQLKLDIENTYQVALQKLGLDASTIEVFFEDYRFGKQKVVVIFPKNTPLYELYKAVSGETNGKREIYLVSSSDLSFKTQIKNTIYLDLIVMVVMKTLLDEKHIIKKERWSSFISGAIVDKTLLRAFLWFNIEDFWKKYKATGAGSFTAFLFEVLPNKEAAALKAMFDTLEE